MDGDIRTTTAKEEALSNATYHLDRAQEAASSLPLDPAVRELRTLILKARLQLTNC